MPSHVQKAPPDRRAIVCRLALDLIRVGARTLFGNVPAAPRALDVLLLCAVTVGVVEARPMNAGKLSHFGGIPRPTAARRLAALQSTGVVSRLPGGGYQTGPALPDDKANAAAQECTRLILRAAAQLSKLDT